MLHIELHNTYTVNFKALDSVVAEAGKNGIRLIMGLVNNYADFGGRRQYVQWAKERGHKVGSDDDFYTNKVVKGYYKNHIKVWLWLAHNHFD